jgi:hypothetical protein
MSAFSGLVSEAGVRRGFPDSSLGIGRKWCRSDLQRRALSGTKDIFSRVGQRSCGALLVQKLFVDKYERSNFTGRYSLTEGI